MDNTTLALVTRLAVYSHMIIIPKDSNWQLTDILSGDILYDNLTSEQLANILLWG